MVSALQVVKLRDALIMIRLKILTHALHPEAEVAANTDTR